MSIIIIHLLDQSSIFESAGSRVTREARERERENGEGKDLVSPFRLIKEKYTIYPLIIHRIE